MEYIVKVNNFKENQIKMDKEILEKEPGGGRSTSYLIKPTL
jgi:hypothetical protein